MTWLVISAVVLGILVGRLGLFADFFASTQGATSWLLCILLFVVGIGLGQNKEIWFKLRRLGWRVVMIPTSIAVGSLLGAAVVGVILGFNVFEAMAVGAGFGWYSLSGVMIQDLGNVQLGAIALLSNAFREILSILFLAVIAKRLGHIVAIAPGGATCMDTTMVLISKTCGEEIGLLGFISGAVLTALVPILVPLLYQLGQINF